MTACAGGAPEEQRFAGGRVADDRHHSRRRARRRHHALQTVNVADELPHLFIAQAGERRHLRAGHARANRVKNIGVFGAVREGRCIQRRTAVALSGGTMTRLARLVVDALAVGNRRRI